MPDVAGPCARPDRARRHASGSLSGRDRRPHRCLHRRRTGDAMLGRLNTPAARGSATVAAENSSKTVEDQCVADAMHIGQPPAESEAHGCRPAFPMAGAAKAGRHTIHQPERDIMPNTFATLPYLPEMREE